MHTAVPQPVGPLLRQWRNRRRLSQLDFAVEANISARHLSFLETGRAQPSRDMLLHLAEQLAIPLRERNVLLVAAGYAPVFPERALDDPALQAARRAIDQVLAGHAPYPALAIDRHWRLVTHNAAVLPLMAGLPAELVQPPINVLRSSLHPAGLAPRIANLAEWRGHLLARLRRQIELTADPVLIELLAELQGYPGGTVPASPAARQAHGGEVAVPFELISPGGTLRFLSTTMVFGTPIDVTLSELALEFFFPADAETAEAVRRAAASGR
jgi:transcriptional regulator with XRE-family HTH domain